LLRKIEKDVKPRGATWRIALKREISEICLMPAGFQIVYDDAKAVDSGSIGPFAAHNCTIYFVLQRLEQLDFRTRLNIVELRRMKSTCGDGSPVQIPVTASSSNFDLLECSAVVAGIVREVYNSERKTYRPLDNLLVVRYVASRQIWSSRGDSSRKKILEGEGWPIEGVDCRAPENTTVQQLEVILHCGT